MGTVKETMVEIISRPPDDTSYDAILRELAYARMRLGQRYELISHREVREVI